MPINLGGGGDLKPYIRWAISDNVWEYSTPEGREEFEMKGATIVADIQGMTLGWMKIDVGVRDYQEWASFFEPTPDPNRADAPVKEWKRGFALDLMSTKLWGDTKVCEFSGNAAGGVNFVANLFNQCEADHYDDLIAGKVPVIKITDMPRKKVGLGNTRDITFTIEKMIDRPEEFDRPQQAMTRNSAPQAPKAEPKPAPVETPASTGDEF